MLFLLTVPVALVLLGASAWLVVVFLVRRMDAAEQDRAIVERELDRLENVLRRDPHRDDARAMYHDLLGRVGRAERARRLEALELEDEE